jgi:hypothetical protein
MNPRQSARSVMIATAFLCAAASTCATRAAASPAYGFDQTIQIPGTSSTTPFTGYDLVTIDPTTQLFYLTDRSFNGIDVFSTATHSFVEQIGTGLFTGNTASSSVAGPNGITISDVPTGKLLIAGNGNSNFIAFNLGSNGLTVQGTPRTISTAVAGTPTPQNRVDGVAYSPTANTILAANNASNPGYLTLVNNANNQVVKSILLNGTGGYPNVGGNGVEATIFNTARNSFFVAVPALNAAGTGAGGVIEIDATTGALLHTFDFNAMGLAGGCSPTGMAQGKGASVFVACSDPTAGHSILLDPTGAGKLKVVPGIAGGDQVSYDPSTNTFLEAARFQPGGPVLGVIDPVTLALQTLPIGGNDHGVAGSDGEAWVPTGPTTAFPGCTNGCIGVFSVPEPSSLPLMLIGPAALVGFAVSRRRV